MEVIELNKEEALEFYKAYNDKCNAYQLALLTMSFDMSTIAPVDGSEYRIQMMSILSGELFEYQTAKENIEKLTELSQMDLDEIMNKEIKLVLKNVNKIALLPKEFYIKMKQVYSQGEITWRKAKKENDYQLFKESLKEIVDITKQAYTYYGIKKSLYDDMLGDFETGMTIEKYEQYLGIRPHDASVGILQDIHWSAGEFGYFPTYALGSAFGAQFLKTMMNDIDIDEQLEHNHFDIIEQWLREHIHCLGALYQADEIFDKVCHEPFNPNIYIDYLIDKYSKLYRL